MKNILMGIVVAMIVAFVWCATPVQAADKLLEAKIDSVTVTKDKNGAEIVRFIVLESKEAGGVKYDKGIPVLAYRENVEIAKRMKQGDTLRAVVSHSSLPDGRESYRILKFDTGAVAKKK